MEQSIFESLLRASTSQSDHHKDEIAFRGVIGEYVIDFYSKYPFDKVKTYEFGYNFKGVYVPQKPTPLQDQMMMEYINLEIVDYENYKDTLRREKEQEERGRIDPYKEYGCNRSDFF